MTIPTLNNIVTEIWDSTLMLLQQEMSQPTFRNWLKNIEPVSLEDGVFTISVPNDFIKDWLERRYLGVIADHASDLTEGDVSVRFVTAAAPQSRTGQLQLPTPEQATVVTRPRPQPNPLDGHDGFFSTLPLSKKNTFETFVVGRSNQLAHAAAVSVANAPAEKYNPLFIYGDVGLGKTHLMQAVGHRIVSLYPSARIVHISGETFLYHVVTSIREDRHAQFRSLYRNVDVWLVDDIQYLAGDRTQVEFFHIFNELYQKNKQIIICSDRPPKELTVFQDRLRSRFEWGLITAIGTPDFEHRIAILQRMARAENAIVSEEVLIYIAERVKTNIRVLEGALTRVLAHASLDGGGATTIAVAEECLRDYSTGEAPRQLTPDTIQQIVCHHYGIDREDITGKKRNKQIVLPRQVAMYLCRELTGLSLPDIGNAFGGRDHSTVIHSYEKVQALVDADASFRATLDELRDQLKT